MTASTDAEIEDWWQSHGQFCRAGGGDYEKTFAYRAWQAARRAPAVPVPQGWKLVPEKPTGKMLGAAVEHAGNGLDCNGMLGRVFVMWPAMLAAAPQPPESLKRENPVTKPEAAPVQMPEPVAKVEDGGLKWHIPDSRYSLPVRYLQGTQMLYTEQQVRDLLAAHGIQERST